MVKKQNSRWPRRIVNSFAVLAYLLLATQWMFSLVAYFPFVASLVPESPVVQPEDQVVGPVFTAPDEGSVLSFFIVAAVLVVMVGLTVYILAKIPSAVAKTGRKTVRSGSEALTHVYAKATHQKETKKLRLRLEHRAMVLMKIILLVAPVGLAYGVHLLPDTTLQPEIAIYLSAFFAQIVLVLFALQYLLAYLLGVKKTDLW